MSDYTLPAPLANLVSVLKGVEALGDRVFPDPIPDGHQVFPACTWREAGGTTVPVSFAGGAPVPQVEIAVYDEKSQYIRMTGIMYEILARMEPIEYGVTDPPTDGYDDDLGVRVKVVGVSLFP